MNLSDVYSLGGTVKGRKAEVAYPEGVIWFYEDGSALKWGTRGGTREAAIRWAWETKGFTLPGASTTRPPHRSTQQEPAFAGSSSPSDRASNMDSSTRSRAEQAAEEAIERAQAAARHEASDQEKLSPNGDLALAFAAAGIPVLPCKEQSGREDFKHPYLARDKDENGKPIRGTGGVSKATCDPAVIREWWKKWPGALVGLAVGKARLLAVDLDRPKPNQPADGVQAYAALMRENGAQPLRQPITLTTTDGAHLFFCLPDGVMWGNKVGSLPAGIDVRGANGYVIAPGTVLPDGATYRAAEGTPNLIEAFVSGSIPIIPSWLFDIIKTQKKKEGSDTAGPDPFDFNTTSHQTGDPPADAGKRERAAAQSALDTHARKVASAPKGKRNEFLYNAAFDLGTMVAAGWLTRREVEERLFAAAVASGYVAEDGRDAASATIASGLDSGAEKPHEGLRDRPRDGASGRSREQGRDEGPGSASQSGAEQDAQSQQDDLIPDPSVLRPDHAAVPRFPLEVFREVGPWMKATAEAMGAPVDYVGTSWLASVAACAGHAYQVEARKGWCEPLVLWFANVGRPSVNKSPAFDPFQRVLYDLQIEANEKHSERVGAWKAAAKLAKIAEEQWEAKAREATKQSKKFTEAYPEACTEEMPGEYRLMLDDVTPEKAASIMAHTDCRFAPLLFKDELASHVLALDRYGKGDAGRMFWLKAFGARSHTVDRQTAPPIHVRRLAISTLGGIQPDKVVTLMASDDDGLVARFLWAYPQPIDPIWPEIGPDHDALKRALRVLVELPAENPLYASLYLPDDLKRAFHAWTLDHLRETRKTVSGRLEGHFGKMQGMFLRLAGTIQVGLAAWRGGGIPTQISRTSFEAARVLIDEYFKPMAHRTFREEGSKGVQTVTTAAAKYIRRRRLRQITVRDLTTNKIVPNADSAEEALLGLVAANWIKAVEGKVRGGRGQVPVVCPVNLKVHAIPEDEEG